MALHKSNWILSETFGYIFNAQFKEISFAYEVLNNPEKREIYDHQGIQGLQEGGSGGGRLRILYFCLP